MTKRKPLNATRPRFHVVYNADTGIILERCIGTESILQAIFAEAFARGEAGTPAAALLERFEAARPLFEQRSEHFEPGDEQAMLDSMARYRDYVGRCAAYEREHGSPPVLYAQQ